MDSKKYLIFSDIHGNVENLHRMHLISQHMIRHKTLAGIWCLGDFDTPQALAVYDTFRQHMLAENVSVVTLPGNHDYVMYHGRFIDGLRVNQPLREGNYTYELFEAWQASPKEMTLLEHLIYPNGTHSPAVTSQTVRIDTPIQPLTIRMSHAIPHSSFTKQESLPQHIRELSTVARTMNDYCENIANMTKHQIDIQIFGHEHHQLHARRRFANDPVDIQGKHGYERYELLHIEKHLLNPGALCNKEYAILSIDSNPQSLPEITFDSLP